VRTLYALCLRKLYDDNYELSISVAGGNWWQKQTNEPYWSKDILFLFPEIKTNVDSFLYFIIYLVIWWNIFSQNATEGYDKILGDQLRNEPTLFVPDAHGILNNVIQHKAAYPRVYWKQTLRIFIPTNCFELIIYYIV